MAEVAWIKIVTDIFDDEKMLLIDTMPESDSIMVIWFKLLCMAGKSNNSGVFKINEKLPYTDEMFAAVFRRPVEIVRKAFDIFEQFGMIERVQGVVTVPNWGKHQNLDSIGRRAEKQREYTKRYREKQKAIASEIIPISESAVQVNEEIGMNEANEDAVNVEENSQEEIGNANENLTIISHDANSDDDGNANVSALDKNKNKNKKENKKGDSQANPPPMACGWCERPTSNDSGVTHVLQRMHDLYKVRFGICPMISPGKDGTQVKRLMQNHPESMILEVYGKYLGISEPFFERQGWPIGTFVSQFNGILMRKDGGNDGRKRNMLDYDDPRI